MSRFSEQGNSDDKRLFSLPKINQNDAIIRQGMVINQAALRRGVPARNPQGAKGGCQMPLEAIPPAVVGGLAPTGAGING